jgi:hypothetical protein
MQQWNWLNICVTELTVKFLPLKPSNRCCYFRQQCQNYDNSRPAKMTSFRLFHSNFFKSPPPLINNMFQFGHLPLPFYLQKKGGVNKLSKNTFLIVPPPTRYECFNYWSSSHSSLLYAKGGGSIKMCIEKDISILFILNIFSVVVVLKKCMCARVDGLK